MNDLATHLADYLRMRRALGFKLRREGRELPQFVAYLGAAGAATVTAELAIAWARLPQQVQPVTWSHRLGMARAFAVYLHTIDPATEIPGAGVFAVATGRRAPYLWSQEDVARLIKATEQLNPPLRAATHEAFFGLVAATGMRLGEAIGLGRSDVDLADGVLTVRQAKGGRARLLPLHPTTTKALVAYAARRDRLCPQPRSGAFLLSSVGTTLDPGSVHRTFNLLTTALGLRTAEVRPRVHDLRHSFAVATLVAWHRRGEDVESRMAVLSAYLGHVNPAGTYWYLSASAELMELAAARLERRLEERR